jgi:chromosome segregation ATPase
MITNDRDTADREAGRKVRTVLSLVLLAVISYELGLGRGRAERRASEYAALKAQYSALQTEYQRDSAQYSVLRAQYDQVAAQCSALKAQYDRIESNKNKMP